MFSANLILSFLLLVVRIYSKGLEEENGKLFGLKLNSMFTFNNIHNIILSK